VKELYTLSAEQLEQRIINHVGESAWPPVHKAVSLAREKHLGQLRKDGADYITHPLRVCLLLLEVGGLNNPDLLCAALLHDVVEDTDTVVEELTGEYGSKVSDLVRSVTLTDLRRGQSKSERDRSHFSSLSWESRDAQILRSADRLDNIADMDENFPKNRWSEYLQDTRDGLLPLTLACNTGLFHALDQALTNKGCEA